MNEKEKNGLRVEKILFICAVLAAGMFFVLFYRRFIIQNYDLNYHKWFAELLFNTDLEAIREISDLLPVHAVTYPLFHLCLKAVAFILGGRTYMACYFLLAAVNMLSIVLYKILFVRIYKPQKTAELFAVDILSIASILFIVLRSPLTEWRYYTLQCAANPVHNPTILFVRPFGILTLLFLVSYLEKRNSEWFKNKNLWAFSVFSLLSVFAKPNFAIVFLPAMGIVTLCEMIREKSIKTGVELMAVVLPSLAALIWQFSFLSGNEIGGEMKVALGGFSGLDFVHIIMASVATFPVVMILFSKKAFKENLYYRISVIALIIGWLQMYTLTNGPTGDFSWGYDVAVQFATVTSLAIAMKYNENRIRRIVAYAAFAWQTFCGIQYILLIYENYNYLI